MNNQYHTINPFSFSGINITQSILDYIYVKSGFLSLGPVDIWGQMILCFERLLCIL